LVTTPGADSLAAFADGEAEFFFHGDGSHQLDLHGDVVAGMTISAPPRSLAAPVTSVVRK